MTSSSKISQAATLDEVAVPRSLLGRVLREPLLHFTVIAAVIFALSALMIRTDQTDPQQIVITDGDLAQMLIAWRAQDRPQPSPAQIRNMLATKVHEEVLYREALAMGLDEDDVIIKRRLAQKMDFLAEDLSDLRVPTREDLRDWLQTHPADFAEPPRVAFSHKYYSFDQHGTDTQAAAISALAAASTGVPKGADRFMYKGTYANQSPAQISAIFGQIFADTLFNQKPGRWAGPIESGFGWHLVHIDSLIPGRVPALEKIEDQVTRSWVIAQREVVKGMAYEAMRDKYKIVLPEGLEAF